MFFFLQDWGRKFETKLIHQIFSCVFLKWDQQNLKTSIDPDGDSFSRRSWCWIARFVFQNEIWVMIPVNPSLAVMRRGSWNKPGTSCDIPRYGVEFVLQNVGLAPWILPGKCANCSCFNSNFECISRLKVWEISWNLMEDIRGYTWIYETKLRRGVCSRRRGRQISKLPEFAVGWLALVKGFQ